MLADLGGEKSGLPFYAILDSKGKKLGDANAMAGGQNIGYPGTPEELTAFEGLLRRAAPKMPAAARAKLIEALKSGVKG